MTKQEAAELETFRRNIERADLPALLRVIQTTLENHVDLLRRCGAPDSLLLMALALSIELQAREAPQPRLVGSA